MLVTMVTKLTMFGLLSFPTRCFVLPQATFFMVALMETKNVSFNLNNSRLVLGSPFVYI